MAFVCVCVGGGGWCLNSKFIQPETACHRKKSYKGLFTYYAPVNGYGTSAADAGFWGGGGGGVCEVILI